MTITIRSTVEGFWRCGVKHSLTAKEYPNDRFSAEELERLMLDDTLVVYVTQGAGEKEIFGPDDIIDYFKMPLNELKKLAKDMGVEYAKNVKQAELAQMISDRMTSDHVAEMAALDKAAAAANQDDGTANQTDDDAGLAGDDTALNH